jgi:GNAT superfamily N-acetyltransferase
MISIKQVHEDSVRMIQDLNHEVMVDNAKYDPDLNVTWTKSELGKKYFTEVLQDTKSAVFVAFDNDHPVGYISLSPKHFGYRNSKYIEVNDMGVIPSHRSQGVGSQLMEHGLSWAKAQGYQRAYVACYSKNDRACQFYNKSGFHQIDVSLEKDL